MSSETAWSQYDCLGRSEFQCRSASVGISLVNQCAVAGIHPRSIDAKPRRRVLRNAQVAMAPSESTPGDGV